MEAQVDEQLAQDLAQRFRSGALSLAGNTVAGEVAPPGPGDVVALPPKGSPEREALHAQGMAAMAQGRVGVAILAGGMATRFKYDHPKGLFPVYEGRSFLDLKLSAVRALGHPLPVYVMTSPATHDEIAKHLAESRNFGLGADQVRLFCQGMLPRLESDGRPFLDEKGQPDLAAAGHGDFAYDLKSSGSLDHFLGQGGEVLLFSNVDNLGATPDPAIVGLHLQGGAEMTIEAAAKAPGDKGGAPALVAGRLRLVEGFAFPKAFDQDRVPVFNTASYAFQAQALSRSFELPWYVVEKQVDGRTAIQFEHLAGDLSAVLSCKVVEVPRAERFWPVKDQGELPAVQAWLSAGNAPPAAAVASASP